MQRKGAAQACYVRGWGFELLHPLQSFWTDRFNIFLLDDFGVLNVEEIAIAALFAQEEKMSGAHLKYL